LDNFAWKPFMQQWNRDLLESEYSSYHVSAEVVRSGWLGYPGATATQIAQVEARLGVKLPPSYRSFLEFTNGWGRVNRAIYKLWSVEEVEWFSVRHQDWIDIWKQEPEPDYEPEAQAEGVFIQSTLEISDVGDGAIYLLNPQIITPDGEWEAWFFANWLPGATIYPSFWEMMQDEHERFLRLIE